MNEKRPLRGWGWPLNSRKAHYFHNGMSLCRKMLYLSDNVEEGNDDSSDNCAACKKALAKHQKKGK